MKTRFLIHSLPALLLFFTQINLVTGQGSNDTIRGMEQYQTGKNSIDRLPVRYVHDLFNLEPSLCRLSYSGAYYSDGFALTDDFTWLDGVPVKFADDLPILLLGSMEYHPFGSYFHSNSSLSGMCSLETLEPADSLITWADGNFSIVRGQVNDLDLQFLISGPILTGKNRIKLGYEVASRIFSNKDSYPFYIRKDQVSGDYAGYLAVEPLRPTGMGYGSYENAEFTLGSETDNEGMDSGTPKDGFSIFGKITLDLPKSLKIDIGTYDVSKNELIPVYENYFFNPDRNPKRSSFYTNNYLKVSGQRDLGDGSGLRFQFLGSYSMLKDETFDPEHGDHFFEYGYVGSFDSYMRPTFEYGSAMVNGTYYPEVWVLNSWDYSEGVDFVPGYLNPLTSAYTSAYYSMFEGAPEGHYQNLEQVNLGGGILNGQIPDQVYGLWNNMGTVYDGYEKNDERKIRLVAEGEYAFGKNLLQFGIQYDRANYSSYSLDPVALWSVLRSNTNFHLCELDLEHPVLHPGEVLDSVFYYRMYQGDLQYASDITLRESLGLNVEGIDFIETDSYSYENQSISYYDRNGVQHTVTLNENVFTLDLFTPEDLVWATNLSYYGFDHTGDRNSKNIEFNDFFNRDDSGSLGMGVGSYAPQVYNAFVNFHTERHKWSLDAGLRLDVFHSGQCILMDPDMLTLAHPEAAQITVDDFQESPVKFNILPQVDFRYRPVEAVGIGLTYHAVLQYPEPDQIFSNPATYYFFYEGLPLSILPNGGLQPERSDQVRLELRYSPVKSLVLSAEPFGFFYTGLIGKVYRPEAFRAYVTYENSEEIVVSYGIDLSAQHRIPGTSGFIYGVTYHLLINSNDNFKRSASYHLPKHVFKGQLVYNTGSGRDYRGPSGKMAYHLFESLGASLLMHYHAEVGYVADYEQREVRGEVPKAMLFDLKMEKGFHLAKGRTYLGFYCIIQNLFDARVVYQVYPATGEPDDDGFLSAPENQAIISEALSEESFRYLYSQYINDPSNYGLPRQVVFGVNLRL